MKSIKCLHTVLHCILILTIFSCEEKDVTPEEPLGQVSLKLEADQDINDKVFDIKIINEEGNISKTLSNLSESPAYIELSDGNYTLSVVSQNQDFQNFGDLVFSGTSDPFNINRSDTIEVFIDLSFDLPPGQVKITLSGIDPENELFSLYTLNADSNLIATKSDISQTPTYIAMDNGTYQFAIQSNNRKYQTVEDIIFSGYSNQFEIAKGDTINLELGLNFDPRRGWISVPDVPISKRFGMSSFVIGDNIYIGFGSNFNNDRFQDFWVYSIANNSWEQLADFPGGKRFAMLSFTIETIGYICLGLNEATSSLLEFWEFNSETKTWTQLEDFPGLSRSAATAFAIGNNVYIGSGIRSGITSLNDFHTYDASNNSWSSVPDFTGTATYGFTSFSIDETGHLMCGVINNDQRTNRHITFNSTNETWGESLAFPGQERLEGIVFNIKGKGYFGLGSIDNITAGVDLWSYDPGTGEWHQAETFDRTPRFNTIYGSNGHLGYLGFGNNSSDEFSDLYLYYPD